MNHEKQVLISGISGGIGTAIARQLAATGWHVIGLGRHPIEGNLATRHVVADFADPAMLEAILKQKREELVDLSAVVSCAGFGVFQSLEELSLADIRSSIDVNLVSHMVLAKHCIPLMKYRQRGDLLFIGSEAAMQGARRGTAYCAGKFGLRGFVQALSAECSAANVRVSLVNPGMVRTPFYNNQGFRPGDDEENAIAAGDVAAAVQMILDARQGTVFDEINLSPRKKVIRHEGASTGESLVHQRPVP